MRSHDILDRRAFIPLFIAIALGASACGGNSSKKSEQGDVNKVTRSAREDGNSKAPSIEVTYYPNGTRSINIKQTDSTETGVGYGNPTANLVVIQECDSGDLVEANVEYSDSSTSDTYQRTPNYPACDNGTLTPEDFVLNSSETIVPPAKAKSIG
jgi:hypothetical protein